MDFVSSLRFFLQQISQINNFLKLFLINLNRAFCLSVPEHTIRIQSIPYQNQLLYQQQELVHNKEQLHALSFSTFCSETRFLLLSHPKLIFLSLMNSTFILYKRYHMAFSALLSACARFYDKRLRSNCVEYLQTNKLA